MSFESEEPRVHGKKLLNKSKRINSGIETIKPWLRSYPTCNPPVDKVAATARRTKKQPLVQLPTNSTMSKTSPTTNEGMKTRFGCKKQSKCPVVSQDSKAKCSGTITPHIDARITRAQYKRSMPLDQSTTTKDITGGMSQRQRKSRAIIGKTYRSPSLRQISGGRSLCTKKQHLTSKWYHLNRSD